MKIFRLALFGIDKFDLELSGIEIDKMELTPCPGGSNHNQSIMIKVYCVLSLNY